MSKRNSSSIEHYAAIIGAITVGIIIGSLIGLWQYSLYSACWDGNIGACMMIHPGKGN